MIRVVKPAAPAVLLTKGTKATKQLCDMYASSPEAYARKSFAFQSTIYADPAVKEALRSAQHGKCAFCESLISHTNYGDVEHYRPKAGYKQKEADALQYPGYYWLAYSWENLFLTCQLCNQKFKQNLFPLKKSRLRARAHTHRLNKEQPLLIDPCASDPAHYIGFEEESPYAIDNCEEGKATILILGLDRDALKDARRRRLRMLKRLVQCRVLLRAKIAEAPSKELSEQLQEVNEAIEESKAASAEYAAMARAFLATCPV